MANKSVLKSGLFVLAGSIMTIAAAENAAAQSLDRLSQADANGDGNIGWQEMLDMRAAAFKRLDRNGDGFADSEDSPRMGPGKKRYGQAMANFKNADSDGDGRISKAEMMAAPAPAFEKGDTNKDKMLSADEIAALRQMAGRP